MVAGITWSRRKRWKVKGGARENEREERMLKWLIMGACNRQMVESSLRYKASLVGPPGKERQLDARLHYLTAKPRVITVVRWEDVLPYFRG
jgi:hypothetical protein